MKLYPECGPCMLKRSLMFCANEDEETRYEVMKEVCRVFSENFSPETTTTEMAFRRNNVIERMIKDKDPMKELKDESIRAAEKVCPLVEGYLNKIKDPKKRFVASLKIALAGNILEYGAQDHRADLNRLWDEIIGVVEGPLAIDDITGIYEKMKKGGDILYVTDNAGELVFDKIFIKEIRKYANVSVAPLSKPVQDDAGVREIKNTGIDKLCPIIPRSDSIGVWFERCTPEFLKKWDDSDFIIVKGMGCYETLVDYPERTRGKVGLLMKAKCNAVAKDAKVPVGSAVVKIL